MRWPSQIDTSSLHRLPAGAWLVTGPGETYDSPRFVGLDDDGRVLAFGDFADALECLQSVFLTSEQGYWPEWEDADELRRTVAYNLSNAVVTI